MLGAKNKQQHRPLGYTIVEVIIVLAISGVMFLIAANFISGKQERAAFTQSSNDMVSRLQNVVEDITDGHYSDVPINCLASSDGSSINFPANGSPPQQGANPQCVFLGKIIHFYTPPGSTQSQNYEIFSLAAARTTNSNPGEQAIPGITTQSVIPQGLYVQWMLVTPASGPVNTTAYNIGFKQGQGIVTDAQSGTYQSGAQTVSLVYTNALTSSSAGTESNIVNNTTTTSILPAKSATICVTDGTQSAVIYVGGGNNNNNQLNISILRQGTGPCG